MNPLQAKSPIGIAGKTPGGLAAADFLTAFALYDNVEIYVAGANLSGHRIIVTDPATGKAIYAQWNNNTHAHASFKMTLQAALLDDDVNVKIAGRITEGSWAWTPGATLYLIANGLLSEAIPTLAAGATFIRPVAVAETATRILLLQHPPIVLA